MNNAERKIFAAHKKAGFYCSQGEDPTDALVKSANAEDLNPEMTRRVSEMLNISLTKAFMKSASDKTATFPLADCEKAIARVFAGEVKAKTASVLSGVDWGCEAGSFSVTRKVDNSKDHDFFKAAKVSTTENVNDLVIQAEGAKAMLKHEISKCAQDLLSTESDALDLYKSVITHFRKADSRGKYAAFEDQCYGEYGEHVAPYLDSIFEHLNEGTERGDSEHSKKAFFFEPDIANQTFDSLMLHVEEMNKQASDLVIARAAFSAFDEEIQSYYKKELGSLKVAGAADEMLDFGKKKADFNVWNDPRLEAAVESHAQQGSGAFAKGLEAEHNRIYKRPGDSADMEVDNVRRQAILADLMNNDEIISAQEPTHVQSAYNTLLGISPRSTLHREVVRSVLRNATAAQAVDPFTAKQLADLEGQHLKNEKIEKGQMAPGAAV